MKFDARRSAKDNLPDPLTSIPTGWAEHGNGSEYRLHPAAASSGDVSEICGESITPASPQVKAFREVLARCIPLLGRVERSDVSLQIGSVERNELVRSWLTENSGQYARTTEAEGRIPSATWPSADLPHVGVGQSKPSYSDIIRIDGNDDHVFVTCTGLPSHIMGPWRNEDGVLGVWPARNRRVYRFPRLPWLAEAAVPTPSGDAGVWVNGISIGGISDGWRYDSRTGVETPISPSDPQTERYLWQRVATTALEFIDPSGGFPSETGEYRYVGNPLGLRCQLGDNLIYLPRAGTYSEKIRNVRHSPILGWTFEGLPIYGPYGYADPLDHRSAVRRMRSGFILRNGDFGTVDLRRTGRRTLPRWAAWLRESAILVSQNSGPDVTPRYPLGRYVEDYDYLGDLGCHQGEEFDLDQCNGRYCVTPEFPDGTFAYFISIDAEGTPVFPYVVGPRSYAVREGGVVDGVPGDAVPLVRAGLDAPLTVEAREFGSRKSVLWNSTEGVRYRIDGSYDGIHWARCATDVPSQGLVTEHSLYPTPGIRPFTHLTVHHVDIDPHDDR